jgi:hypothetical protein
MIDNPGIVERLILRLQEALPLSAHTTREVLEVFQKKYPHVAMPEQCCVREIHYMGEEGGIVCKLDFGPDFENTAFVSITHLRFDHSLPLTHDIIAYQTRRAKRIRRSRSI